LASDSYSVRISTLILSLAMIPSGLIMVGEATAIAYGRTRLIAFVTTLENVLRTIIPLGLIWFGFEISAVCVAFVGVRFAALSVFLVAVPGRFSKFSFNTSEIISLIRLTPTFAGTIIFASINWQAAVILLGSFSTEAESAKYGAASRFLIPVSILMASYASVIQPALTQYAQKGIEQTGLYISKIVRYPLLVATLAAVISPFASRGVLTILFGTDYAAAAPTLDLLALGTVPFCIVMVMARGLVATKSQHIDLLANVTGVAVCISVGIILIPDYGSVGAAAAQLLSFVVMSLIEVGYLTRKITGLKVVRAASLSSACLLAAYIIIWKL